MTQMGRVKVWDYCDPDDPQIGYLGEGKFMGRVPLTRVYSRTEQKEKFLELCEETMQLSEDELAETMDNILMSFARLDYENNDTAMIQLDSGKTVYGCNVVWESC
jgi:non-ribosomal peptide synthetase component E (peptide arylation enzyme)